MSDAGFSFETATRRMVEDRLLLLRAAAMVCCTVVSWEIRVEARCGFIGIFISGVDEPLLMVVGEDIMACSRWWESGLSVLGAARH